MLIRQMLRENLYIAVGYYLLMQGALIAAVLYWPDFRDNLPAIAKMVPFDAMRKLITAMEDVGYWPYFCVQQFFKGNSLFGLTAAALMGSGLIAREVDNGTAEFLLSRPISRTRILMTRWAVGVALLTIPVFLSSWGGWLMGPWIDEPNIPLRGVMLGSAYMSLFLTMLFSATVWLSTLFDHQLRAGVLLVGLMLLQFALYLVKIVGDYTLFALVDLEELMPLIQGKFPWEPALAFVVTSLVFLGLALRQFHRRDF
ncbi:MAG: hypothetical protein DWQ01_11365 [Planctomycetota bacterium]|nr:MAG: hypothetical protein DWQ01_11365 [Planctomycetota bacterium]